VGTLATSNLGFVFGSLNARPWFHGIYFSTFLVISGIVAGAGLLMLVHNIVYKFNVPAELDKTMKALAKLMGGGIGMMAFLYLWKILTSLFNAPLGAYESVMALISGPLAVNFWVGEMGLAIIVPLLLLIVAKGNTKIYGLAGLIYMVGLFFTRFDFIVAGQLPVMREGFEGSNVITDASGLAQYTASAGEWGIFMLGIGTALVLYFAAEKFLDLKTPEHH
jgi:molybdopterin-containing oxidoreductase family membrane subunit